ncbi:MAG: tRNA 2-selenouridine(34) synthase MnmH [Chitinophagaceae bacterium]
MAIQKLSIEEFLKKATLHPVLDVRSPGEYQQAHIPNAHNIPLFEDEERKVVGTAYKQESRERAIKLGLDYFGGKMSKIVEAVEAIKSQHATVTDKIILVHCWRGGMRSAGVAWLLDLYGFKVFTLMGGYKAYRTWVLEQFEKKYPFTVIGGYTGSGKTLLLEGLQQKNKSIIDLEALANHKGSAFGSMGAQPRQEMFENLLATKLFSETQQLQQSSNPTHTIYIEDESQRIGNLQIPMALWPNIRNSKILFFDIPFEERLNYITETYGKLERDKLVTAIMRIQKRLGGLETKNAINFLLEENTKESFRILLRYYDKWYEKGLQNRENITSLLNKIPCLSVDTITNVQKIQ